VALSRAISDYYVAGRLVPGIFNGMAIALGLLPAIVMTGFGAALGQGWDGATLLVLGGAGGLLLAGVLIAPYLRKFGGYTLPDFLAERFEGAGLRPLALLAVIGCSFPLLAATLMGLGALTMRLFGVEAETGLALAAIMLLLCSVVAGMRSASLAQIAQYGVLVAVSLVVLALLYWQRGTLFPIFSVEEVRAAFAAPGLEGFAARDPANRFALFFCLAAGAAALPHLLLRGLVTPSVGEARTSFLWALPFAALLCFLAAPYVLLAGTEASFTSGLLAIGGIAGLLALGSALALAVGNTLSFDLFFKTLHPAASTGQRISVARIAVVLATGLAAWAALELPDTIPALAGTAFSLAASAFLPALLLGIWWKRATAEGALAGMLAGLAVCLYYMLAPRYIPFAFYESSSFLSNATQEAASHYEALQQSYYLADEAGRAAALAAWEEAARPLANWWGVAREFAALFAVPVGFLTMIGVSLFTPEPSRKIQSFVEDLRKTQPA
jgi:cation/acetate symporter